jgi:hypothetical protein
MGCLKQSRKVLRKKTQLCDDGSKGEEKEEVLDASQWQRQGKGF